jgi:chromate transporter
MSVEVTKKVNDTVQPRFSEAARFWWKLGWISFGGTAAHLAILHEELVVKKRWISEPQFLHALSHCMILPGPEAQQLATYVGWKLHRTAGGIVAGALFVLPSMVVLLALSLIYVHFGQLSWIAGMIQGLRPAVVTLVVLALIRVAGRTLQTRAQWIVALAAFAATGIFQVSLPVVMLVAILLGLFLAWRYPATMAFGSADREDSVDGPRRVEWGQWAASALRIGAAALGLWAIPLLLLYFRGVDLSFWKQLSLFFTKTAFVTFGGSYTVIPYVAHVAVTKYGWLNQAQMLDGFSLAETTPGPLIIVVAFVGFMAAFNHFHGSVMMGTIALILTTFYTFLPCFVFVFAGAPLVEVTHGKRSLEGALRMITAVVVAAMLKLAVFLCRGALFPTDRLRLGELNVFAAVWIVVCFVLLRRLKVGMPGLVGLSLLAGLVHSLLVRA